MFVKILIIIFIILLLLQFLSSLKEGMETNTPLQYKNYDDDPFILSKKNAANIDFLKEQNETITKDVAENTKKLTGMDKLREDIDILTDQVNSLAGEQATYAEGVAKGFDNIKEEEEESPDEKQITDTGL